MLSGSPAVTAGEKGNGDTPSAIPSNAGGRPCQCVIARGAAHSPSLFPSHDVKSISFPNLLCGSEISVSVSDTRTGLCAQKLLSHTLPCSYMI